jgi:aspartate/methionine/tyrosine aminotransferase
MTERYGVAVRAKRVVVTAGSSAGFVLAFLALLDQGDTLVCRRRAIPAIARS